MNKIRSLLPKYFTIFESGGSPVFLQTKYSSVTFNNSDSTKHLWKIHEESLQKPHICEKIPAQSLLDLKIELADRIFENCQFCERKCNSNRKETTGKCGVQEAKIASEFIHLGEESVLIPSYTIFFSGCTFHCVFCQNWDISQRSCGYPFPPTSVATMITKRQQQGAINVNWVGGDPTPNVPFILKVLKESNTSLPQIWNSNMYCSLETMHLLKGVMDLYLTDFKYGNDACAKELSNVSDYSTIVERNHMLAAQQGEVLIRHLVLPNHLACCSQPILEWIKEHLPCVPVNLMAQYRPEYQAHQQATINRQLTTSEYQQVLTLAKDLDIVLI